ncbi:transposase domain-containing protein [candidate division KSB1 bacterium]|nr:transposase domain-containing protein [candidate division KSB1 bacterium]
MGTCKQNNVEPFAWLKDVINRLPEHNQKNIDELLPGNWQPIID